VAAGNDLRDFLLRTAEEDTAQETVDAASGDTLADSPDERTNWIAHQQMLEALVRSQPPLKEDE
jgi:hypothetical protein